MYNEGQLIMADSFKKRLKELRETKGLNQPQLADKIGVATATICHFEKGFRRPTLDHLLRLATALGVPSIDYLLGQEAARATSATEKLMRDIERLSSKDLEIVKDMIKSLLKRNKTS